MLFCLCGASYYNIANYIDIDIRYTVSYIYIIFILEISSNVKYIKWFYLPFPQKIIWKKSQRLRLWMSSEWIPVYLSLPLSQRLITKHPRFFLCEKNRLKVEIFSNWSFCFWNILPDSTLAPPLPSLILTRGKLRLSSLLLLILGGLLVSRDIMRWPSVNYPALSLLWLTSKLNKQNLPKTTLFNLST